MHLSCFTADIEAFNLEKEDTQFVGTDELQAIMKELFRINPNLKCKVKYIVNHEPFLTFHLYLWDFVCGATADSVWNCRIKGSKINKVWFTK